MVSTVSDKIFNKNQLINTRTAGSIVVIIPYPENLTPFYENDPYRCYYDTPLYTGVTNSFCRSNPVQNPNPATNPVHSSSMIYLAANEVLEEPV
jgi:hypothetical protein